jgi:integrase
VIDGVEEKYTDGTFYIDWTEDGRRHRESVGTSPANAVARQLRKETELKAIAQGIEIKPEDNDKRRRIDAAIADYLSEVRLTKKPKTDNAYTGSLDYFTKSCTKTYLDEIERKDMLQFHAYLRNEAKLAPRTCWNKFANVMSFLKWAGLTGITKKGDWPDYVEEEPEVYDQDDLDAFFKACSQEELLLFHFFMGTGFREQEVMHATWKDINFKKKTVAMTWKPQFGWTPKAYKERTVPCPSKLLELLTDAKGKHKPDELIFPNTEGNPNGHFLRYCVAAAKRADLNADGWWLHKFRATYATKMLRITDLKTVQKFLGHVDLQSTMRYLSAATAADVQDKVNAEFA